MICSWCHEKTASTPCEHCGGDPELDGRWRLLKSLGSGAAGQTWLAESIQDKRKVAIKELTYRKIADFKQLELFEREAKVLETLKHSGIPKYFEDFVVEEGRHVSFYLVQELIEGKVRSTQSPTDEKEVARMMLELVEVLKYLASRRPPVIHRDIKPSNIMRRNDGSFVLIDFGTTRAALDQTIGQSTVAGTLGYMAPEQLLGRASTASDVYGLAATVVALLAGKDASDLIDPHRPNQWRKKVKMSPAMADLLEKMLRVDVDRRLANLDEISKTIGELEKGGAMVVHKEAPLIVPKKREGESIRDGLIEFSRNPFDVLVISSLCGVGMVIYMSTMLTGGVVNFLTGVNPSFLAFNLVWQIPLATVLLHVAAFALGLKMDPQRGSSVGALTRFRPVRKMGLMFFRDTHISFRVFFFFLFGMVLLGPTLGLLSLLGLGHQWAIAVPGLFLLDQVQATSRGRTRWRRAIGPEFADAWPSGSEQRKAFVKLANKLWCNLPGWATKSDSLKYHHEIYKNLERLREHPSLDLKQREHVDLILLTATYYPKELLERIRSMEPRRATVEALKARIDYGSEDNNETTGPLVSLYQDHQRRAR